MTRSIEGIDQSVSYLKSVSLSLLHGVLCLPVNDYSTGLKRYRLYGYN